jgi:hypothetical protein
MAGNTDEQWLELLSESTKTLLSFFQGEATDPQAVAKARIATSVLSSFTRHEGTESAREQTRLIVGRQLAEDKEAFAAYVRLAMPQGTVACAFAQSLE